MSDAHVAPPAPPQVWPPWRLARASGVEGLAPGLLVVALLAVPFGGMLAGRWGQILPGLAASVLCLIFLRFFVRAHRLPADQKRWLVGLCMMAFSLRLLLAVVILNGPWDYLMFSEDQAGYDHLPRLIAHSWSGDSIVDPLQALGTAQPKRAYFDLVALQYLVFGPEFLVPRVFNALAGTLVVFYTVSLAARTFGVAQARVTGVWMALFPAMLLWSALNLRDIWLTLSVVVVVHHALALRDRPSFTSMAIIVANLLWVHFNRGYLVVILAAACLGAMVFGRSKAFLRDLAIAAFLGAALIALYQQMGLGKEGVDFLNLDRLAEQREKLARADVGRSGYLADVDIRNPAELTASAPLLLAYFLFSPFPWQMTVIRRAVLAPEMVFWYWLMPFVLVAFRHIWRERTGRQFALFVTLVVVTFAFAIPSGNMGLAYRYRAQIIPIFLAFAAAGFTQRRSPAGVVGAGLG